MSDQAAIEPVADLLRAMREPSGEPLVAAVHKREDLYAGAHVGRAPELLVEMADESVDLHDGLHAATPWVSRADVPWGTHRTDGVVAITGAPATGKGEAPDVAATVLDLLGLDVAGLDGRSLAGGAGDHRAVRATAPATQDAVYSDDEEAAVLEHLRGLGYVD